jgi:thioredoxin 1
MVDHIKILTDDSFDLVQEETEFPMIIHFETSWCGTCHLMNRILDQLACDFKHQVHFFKVDVEINKAIPKRFQILEIPSLLMINNGQIVNKIEGIISRKDLEKKIAALVELSSHR